MNNPDIKLKDDIMRRVRVIYAIRRARDSAITKGVIFAVCCGLIAYAVSIPHVIQNMSGLQNILDDSVYLIRAFDHAKVGVEALLVIAGISCIWFIKDMVKNVRQYRMRTAVM